MATEIILRKLHHSLVPADRVNLQLMEGLKMNREYKVVISSPRNLQFHKKLFSLLNYAFSNWEHEPVFFRDAIVEDNFDVFRENVIIMAGYGYPVVNLKGEVRYRAKSISFGSMKEEEFEQLYSAVIDAILKNVLDNHSKQELINGVLSYG